MPLDPGYAGRSFPPTVPYVVGREKIREFARAIGAMMLVHGTGAYVDQPLQPGQGARPVEQRDRSHQVDVDDASRIVRLRLYPGFLCRAARDRRYGGAVNDVRDVVWREGLTPGLRPGDVGDDDRKSICDRSEIAHSGCIRRGSIEDHKTRLRLCLEPVPRKHAHDESGRAGNE